MASAHTLAAYALLGGLAAAGLVLACGLARRMFWTARTPTGNLLELLEPLLAEARWTEAASCCAGFPGAPARMLRAGIEHWEQGPHAVEMALEQAAETEFKALARGLGWMGLIANLAPLVGFVGSMTPMFRSFHLISLQGLNNPGQIASGIVEALGLIGAGVAVAIPSLALYNWLHLELAKYVVEFDTLTRRLARLPTP